MSSRPSFMRRIAPAVVLGTAAIGVVALFDPALHSGGSDALASAPMGTGSLDGATGTSATGSGGATGTGSATGSGAATGTGGANGADNSSTGGNSNAGDTKNSGKSSASNASCDNGQTIEGDTIQTRYGPVQASAVVVDGQVCQFTVVQYPQSDPRSRQISAQVVPWLEKAATAQGANFQHVSGATYTTEGYRQSVQSILDQL